MLSLWKGDKRMTAKVYDLNEYRKKKECDNIIHMYKKVDNEIVKAYENGMCDGCHCQTNDLLPIDGTWLCRSCAKL